MGKSLYLTAVIATLAIISVVFFAVSYFEGAKVSQLNDEISGYSLEGALQSAYADFDSENRDVYCTVINQGISNLSKRADALERQLSAYKENSFNSAEFYSVKRNYLLTNMILYRNFLSAKENCDLNTKAVLFFYAEDKSCDPDCGVIGTQLFNLRDCASFRSFNFPYNWDFYEFTKILEVKYGISKAGTLIIDGAKYESLLDIDELTVLLGCES